MKLSVSLPDEDAEFVDRLWREHGYESRSAVIRRAVRLLRISELAGEYAGAWQEWEGSADADLWDSARGDGLADAAR